MRFTPPRGAGYKRGTTSPRAAAERRRQTGAQRSAGARIWSMNFHFLDYLVFLALVLSGYWLLARRKMLRLVLLVVAS